MEDYKRGTDPELKSLTNQTSRCERVTNKATSQEPTRALDNKYWSSSEVRGLSGLGIWADFLEEVGLKMSLMDG